MAASTHACPTCGRDIDTRGFTLHARAHDRAATERRQAEARAEEEAALGRLALEDLPRRLREDLDGIATPVGPMGPARAYLTSEQRAPDGTNLWRVLYYAGDGRAREVVGPDRPWRDAVVLVRALNRRAGHQQAPLGEDDR